MDRPIPLKQLRRALKAYGVLESPDRGKGSHTYFHKLVDGNEIGYPIPTTREPVLRAYIKGARRRFKLTPADGITDKEFYGQ